MGAIEELRAEIIRDAKSINKNFTDDYAKGKSIEVLICMAHPRYRDDYLRKLCEIKSNIREKV